MIAGEEGKVFTFRHMLLSDYGKRNDSSILNIPYLQIGNKVYKSGLQIPVFAGGICQLPSIKKENENE